MKNLKITLDGVKVITAHLYGNLIRTDQPVENGGGNAAPAPFDLFLASIGTCAGIYVKSFCEKRESPSALIKTVRTIDYVENNKTLSSISLDIQFPAGFPERYRNAVLNAAELCLVKETINNKPDFKIITSQH